ncbi:hypothetical protein HAX54_042002, partial [Datura stramonium]|nr:hypothetical protein [Datura stramonium]
MHQEKSAIWGPSPPPTSSCPKRNTRKLLMTQSRESQLQKMAQNLPARQNSEEEMKNVFDRLNKAMLPGGY